MAPKKRLPRAGQAITAKVMSLVASLKLSRVPVMGFATLGLFWGSFAALAPVIKAQVGASDATFGLVITGMALGLSATVWFAPRFDAALGARALPTAGAMMAGAFLLPGHAMDPMSLFMIMILLGMCSGLQDVVMNTRVSELELSHARPLMNANHGTFSLAYAAGAIATGAARELGFGPAEILSAVSLLGFMALPLLRGAAPVVRGPTPGDAPLPASLIWLCAGIVLVAFTAEASVEVWSAVHIERTLGGRAAEGATGPAILGLTMAIGRYWGQSLTHRYPDTRLIEMAGLVTIIGAIVAAIAQTPFTAYVGFGLLGLGVSIIAPLALAITGRLSPPAARATAIARVSVIGFLGYMVAPAGVGLISDWAGLRGGFLAVAALIVTIPLLTHLLKARFRL
jgi:MFS family permease